MSWTITLNPDEAGEALRGVYASLIDCLTERLRYIEYVRVPPDNLLDRIARLEALDKRLTEFVWTKP